MLISNYTFGILFIFKKSNPSQGLTDTKPAHEAKKMKRFVIADQPVRRDEYENRTWKRYCYDLDHELKWRLTVKTRGVQFYHSRRGFRFLGYGGRVLKIRGSQLMQIRVTVPEM
jgi:hypothetical protein